MQYAIAVTSVKSMQIVVMPNFYSSIFNVQSVTGAKFVSKVYFLEELMSRCG